MENTNNNVEKKMDKKMDVNFAFAILFLAAAIVGIYFWIDNGRTEVEEIYQDTNEVRVQMPSNMEEEEMMEDEMMEADTDMGTGSTMDNDMEEETMMEGEVMDQPENF